MRTGLIMLLVLVAACGADTRPALVASDVTITQPMPGMAMSAGYLTLTNNSAETITITRVNSPQYAAVELHESVVDDGVARMRRLEKIEIPAGKNTVLAPGGKHLMLMRPTEVAADAVSLQFYDGATLLLTVTSSKPQDSR